MAWNNGVKVVEDFFWQVIFLASYLSGELLAWRATGLADYADQAIVDRAINYRVSAVVWEILLAIALWS